MKKPLLLSLAAAIVCANTTLAYAEPAKTKMDAELDVGLEYNSSLAVDELDTTTNQSDTATLFNGKLNGQWGVSDRSTLRGGYSYLSKNYRDNSDFDLAIHQLSADASHDFDLLTVGVSHFFARAELDGDHFLDLNQSSLYGSKLFDKRIFVRVAADVRDKAFDGRPERDADSLGLGSDVYVFFNDAKTYVSVGINGEQEDARASELDYDGLTFRSKLSNKFRMMNRDNKLALSYRYVDRDYDNTDPLIGSARADRRHTTRLEWEVELMKHLGVVSSLEYGDYQSNLDSADYSDTKAMLALRLKL